MKFSPSISRLSLRKKIFFETIRIALRDLEIKRCFEPALLFAFYRKIFFALLIMVALVCGLIFYGIPQFSPIAQNQKDVQNSAKYLVSSNHYDTINNAQMLHNPAGSQEQQTDGQVPR